MPNINEGVLDGLKRMSARVRDLAIGGGLPGAPLGLRLRGSTASGAPVTGTWKPGDFITDRAGKIWICIAGGTPGSWVQSGKPLDYLTVSPTGLSNGAVTKNNGADYGPDTPGTVTCGIQEALNALPPCSVYDAFHNLNAGVRGTVRLLPGMFNTTAAIVIPAGTIKLLGSGTSSWSEVFTISSPSQDLGGTVILGSTYTQSIVTCPVGSFGYPATALWMDGIEMRLISPASNQGSGAPALFNLIGHVFGEISNVAVLEAAAGGGVGNNMYVIADFSAGTTVNDVILRNIRGYGGHTGIRINRAHVTAYNISGGKTGNSIDTQACGINIGAQLENSFSNLHCFSSNNGISFQPYNAGGGVVMTQAIHGVHFESCTHILTTGTTSVTPGLLLIDAPIWQSTANPASDIAAQLAGRSSAPSITAQTGLAVITGNELNPQSLSGWHVTVPAAAWTAGTSPYSFPQLPYACVFVITAAGGMTSLTLDGQALFGGSFSAGQQVYVGAGHSLVATWATTAPVFQVLPQ